jgi:hypothetical protein
LGSDAVFFFLDGANLREGLKRLRGFALGAQNHAELVVDRAIAVVSKGAP